MNNSKGPTYWQVIDAETARANPHLDIGDISEIDTGGKLLRVEELPGNRVRCTERRDTYIVCNSFLTFEQARTYARKVLSQEIIRLQGKYAHPGCFLGQQPSENTRAG